MCDATVNDDGSFHNDRCYCHNTSPSGYTYQDEYGDCPYCEGQFETGTVICAGPYNNLRVCPDTRKGDQHDQSPLPQL